MEGLVVKIIDLGLKSHVLIMSRMVGTSKGLAKQDKVSEGLFLAEHRANLTTAEQWGSENVRDTILLPDAASPQSRKKVLGMR